MNKYWAALADRPMSTARLAEHLGVKVKTATVGVAKLAADGLLVKVDEEPRQSARRREKPVTVWAVKHPDYHKENSMHDEVRTGRTRYRVDRPWYKPYRIVLQVEVKRGDGPPDRNGMPEFLGGTYWRDATLADVSVAVES